MKYMLDTNICIYAIKNNPIQTAKKIASVNRDDICISSITLAELEFGACKSNNPIKNKTAVRIFLSGIKILPFDDAARRLAQTTCSLPPTQNQCN